MSTGAVPQWYMNAPAHFGRKVNDTEAPFTTDIARNGRHSMLVVPPDTGSG
jgi:hypothetical protein